MKDGNNFQPGSPEWHKLKVKVFINSVKLAKGAPGMIARIEKQQGYKVKDIPELCRKYQIPASSIS